MDNVGKIEKHYNRNYYLIGVMIIIIIIMEDLLTSEKKENNTTMLKAISTVRYCDIYVYPGLLIVS